jgi:stage II sporulation protein M
VREEQKTYAGLRYRWWIVIAIALFAIGIAFGLTDPLNLASLLSDELISLGELGGILAPFTFTMFIFIFLKNVVTLLFSFIFSPILAIIPVVTLLLNGWIVGLVSTVVTEQESLGFVLAGLLPHGVIELPALFIGEAAALSFGITAVIALFKKEKRELFLPSLKQNLRYLTLAVALMLPAAAIETFLTPLLVGY